MTHTCEDDLVVKSKMDEKVPYFNAPIYLENKQQIGKVDEIFGPIRDYVSLYLLIIIVVYLFTLITNIILDLCLISCAGK